MIFIGEDLWSKWHKKKALFTIRPLALVLEGMWTKSRLRIYD